MKGTLTAPQTMHWETVRCAFCRGAGTDPFDVMSSLSTCCVCGGRGTVSVPKPYVHCAHCGATGAVKTLTCTVCHGKGLLGASAEATVTCTDCRGSGDDGSAPAMACLRCGGRGWVPGATVETESGARTRALKMSERIDV